MRKEAPEIFQFFSKHKTLNSFFKIYNWKANCLKYKLIKLGP